MRKIRAFDPTAQEYDQLPPASILTKNGTKLMNGGQNQAEN
jgi:hypothetical protein